jgi:hypothetical protein
MGPSNIAKNRRANASVRVGSRLNFREKFAARFQLDTAVVAGVEVVPPTPRQRNRVFSLRQPWRTTAGLA